MDVPQDGPQPTPKESEFVELWARRFSTDWVVPREAADLAFRDTRAYVAMCAAIPDMHRHPHPALLIKWLAKNENRVIATPDGPKRVARAGRRWSLLPVPAQI